MATIEVERQLLPILDSPIRGRVFTTRSYRRPNRSFPVTAPVPLGPSIQYRMTSKAAGDNTDSGGTDGLHVCRQQFVSVYALQRALGAHPDRQRRVVSPRELRPPMRP